MVFAILVCPTEKVVLNYKMDTPYTKDERVLNELPVPDIMYSVGVAGV